MLRLGPVWLFLVALLGSLAGAARCDATSVPAINDFQHTAWTTRDGAPSTPSSFAQTTDGYLWIGSSLGLYRFDGVRFEQMQTLYGTRLLSEKISTLFVDTHGDLWIGYARGGMSLLQGGRVTHFRGAEGLPPGSAVFHFAQDTEDRLWAATQAGLLRLNNGHWDRIGPGAGFDEPLAQEVAVDQEGNVWVLSSQDLFTLPKGTNRFQKVAPQLGANGFVYRHNGTIWMTQSSRSGPARIPYLNGSVVGKDTPGYVLDHSGGLWIENTGDGIYRVSNAARLLEHGSGMHTPDVHSFTTKDGLTGTSILSIFEDREQNVWVGTESGVDRFTPSSFVSVLLPPGASRLSVAQGEHDSILVSTFHHAAIVVGPDGAISKTIPVGGTVGAVYRAAKDSVWLSTEKEILHMQGGRMDRIPLPDFHVRRAYEQVIAMTLDDSGSLWISVEDKGVFHYTGKAWQQIDTGFASPGTAALCVFKDSAGTMWFGYPDNLIVTFSPSRRRAYERVSSSQIGNIKLIAEAHGTVWAGGDQGVAYHDGDAFRRIALPDQAALSGLSGMVFAKTGDLFLTVQSGVLRIASSEVDAVRTSPATSVRYTSLDFASVPAGLVPLSRSVAAADGHLWFLSLKGLAWLNPSQPWPNPPPPSVLIQTVTAQNESYDARPALAFPPRTKSVNLRYTAASLVSSESVRFRYRLEGSDAAWQDAGTRREAFYTNLGPGTYTFHVIACGRDGRWSDSEASLTFRILPAFNQTGLFYILCACLFCAVMYLLYLSRVRRVVALYEMKNAERLAERERIARELHDTLLQGVHGLILRFSVLTGNYPEGDITRAALDDTLVRAEKMLIEGRQRVRNLRAETSMIDLPQALLEAGRELASNAGITFELLVQGTPRLLRRTVSEEIFTIGREAINNSVLHAHGTRVEAELIYSRSAMQVRIRDDGHGLEPEVMASGHLPDHWGLPGMQERAAALGAELNIYSKADFGTEIELRVPSQIAYQTISPIGLGRRAWRDVRRIVFRIR